MFDASVAGVNGAENSPPQNSHDLEAEWGPAYYNATHRWVTSVTRASRHHMLRFCPFDIPSPLERNITDASFVE
jgi:hypothetical protein